MKIALFVYDFAHRKSAEFLTRLWLDEHDVIAVIGNPFKSLERPPEVLRVKPRRAPSFHPRTFCDRVGIPYYAIDHRDPGLPDRVREMGVELGLIAGARILPHELIEAPSTGIVNFHPGLLPEVRGLDALKWSVYKGVPPGVTVHFIDARVDAGRIIDRVEIPVREDDGWVDISLRIEDTQVELLTPTIEKLNRTSDLSAFPPSGDWPVNRAMSAELQEATSAAFEDWRAKFAKRSVEGSP